MKHGWIIVLSIILVPLSGCARKIKVTTCIIDAADRSFACSTYSGQKFVLTYPQVDNFVCLSQDDAKSVYESCRRAPITNVEVCLMDSATLTLICNTSKNKPRSIDMYQADGYVCFSPEDVRKIFDYCAKR